MWLGQQTGLWERMKHPFGDTQKKNEGTLTGKELLSQERSKSQENYFSEWLRGLNKKSHVKSGTHTKYFISYISFP